jgi:hypothetical protein
MVLEEVEFYEAEGWMENSAIVLDPPLVEQTDLHSMSVYKLKAGQYHYAHVDSTLWDKV